MTSYPGATLTRRYIGTDETGRPIDLWSYPGSGNATRVWAINPSAFGGETPLVGTSVFQPFGRSAASVDRDSGVLIASGSAIQRPPLEVLGPWIVDPLSAAILQPPPSAANAADAAKIKVDGDTIYDYRDWLINGFPGGEICTAVGYFWDEGDGYGVWRVWRWHQQRRWSASTYRAWRRWQRWRPRAGRWKSRANSRRSS
jgi:hypothetical protein